MSEPVQRPQTATDTPSAGSGGAPVTEHTPVAEHQHPGTTPLPGDPGFKAVLSKNAAKRANASVIGMILALLVSLACILPVILLNAQPQQGPITPPVDVAGVSRNAASVAGFTPSVPELPDGWKANYARWNSGTADGVPAWEVGFLSPSQGFVGLTQTVKGNPTWVTQQAENAPVTGTRTIAGHDWTLRDKGKGPKTLVLDYRGYTLILNGTAELKEFDVVGAAVLKAVDASPAVKSVPTPRPSA
ncbi:MULTISPECIES: DUF4245 domain-containing protein [Arthrobacter]|uniref:DUF4245 domain-containing protein n=2 Tax=Arthrobacter TaxID=1663 RepID=A0ABU9KKE6_9MICC|nr:DUF4245 domain-containing protein [Arthrobacter sp. YJM1]MDP5227374.1 DUF4245 domain-containing protein [Arthrobacter sp. YJM1]